MSDSARLAAQAKKPADYEAPKDAEDNRSAEEIERDLKRVREEMTATVNELAARLDPAYLANEAKANAQVKLEETKVKAKNLANDAAAGDTKSIAIIGGVVLAVGGLILKKILSR